MPAKRATLADVAALAGVSPTAASLVLNNRPGNRLSAQAAERIRAAAERLDYRPHPAARSLRMGKTQTVAFLSDDVTITREPTNDNRSYHVSSARIKAALGFEATRTIEDAVRDLVAAFRAGRIPDPFGDIRYHNIKTMQAVRLK